MAVSCCSRSVIAVWGVSSTRSATTWTFCSAKSSPASRPAWTTQNPARSMSIRVIVAVAARLIAALRQKPCQARWMLKPRKANIGLGRPVVAAADLVPDDPALLEGHDALAEGGDDVGVVGRHEDRDAELVDAEEQLQGLPRDQGIQVARRLVGDDDPRVVDEGPGDRGSLLLAAGQLARVLGGLLGEADEG